MSDLSLCRNPILAPHPIGHPSYARDGYCFLCADAGVAELVGRIAERDETIRQLREAARQEPNHWRDTIIKTADYGGWYITGRDGVLLGPFNSQQAALDATAITPEPGPAAAKEE